MYIALSSQRGQSELCPDYSTSIRCCQDAARAKFLGPYAFNRLQRRVLRRKRRNISQKSEFARGMQLRRIFSPG
jgi:hypothetical protein